MRAGRIALLCLLVGACACPSVAAARCPAPPPGATGADPLRPLQWGLDQINAPAAWQRGFTGEGVVVAMLDSGVAYEHPDLAANLLPGVDLVAPGSSGCPGDEQGKPHGTRTAGLLGAVAGNGIGISGVAPAVRILPIRVCDGACEFDAILKGVSTAVERGATVINMSIAGFWAERQAQFDYEAIDRVFDDAWDHGVTLVAIAGNNKEPGCADIAYSAHVICAGATDRRGLPASYTNLAGTSSDHATVFAPGGEVGARAPVDDVACSEGVVTTTSDRGTCESGYVADVGSSYAAPHVAGVAAMLAQAGLTNRQIVDRIVQTATNAGAYDPLTGYGVVDADAATRGLVPRLPSGTGAPGPMPGPAAVPAPSVRRTTRACRQARGRLHRATAAALRARAVARSHPGARSRRLLRARLRDRERAQRRVNRACGR